ncbi:MAG: radical SAM protein [Selenomonadales bacterium]|jgi:MoaA/NifB/PqqE/SkfB family radical SAM enzyme|nr:radical SAM protein [Selenomonadales bacterium]
MGTKGFIESAKGYGLKRVLSHLGSEPNKNIPRVLNWVDRFDKEGVLKGKVSVVREVLSDEGSNWSLLTKSLWTDIDTDVRKRLFENFIVNAVIIGGNRQEKAREEHGCNVPWAILMDPTSACNMRCSGCWAAEYGPDMSLSYHTLDSVIQQGKALGIYMYIYSGGEPLLRKDDIVRLCERHSDCVFLAFTNGTLIDETFADEMLRVKNFVPAISVEGFEYETDSRRGEGTYLAVENAMEVLKIKKLPFGISCCYTSNNTDKVGSEAFFDKMISNGAKFAWFFTYMPVGMDASPELMANAEQREFMYQQVRRFRKSKAIFTMDFWNDGEYADGCIGGGRRYLHINANGDIEPCAFIHYSDSNIHDTALVTALRNPLFMQYKENQPFNGNMLRPCPLLDNPDRLRDMVTASGARSTETLHPEDVGHLCEKCRPASVAWAVAAERLWVESSSQRPKRTD